MIFSAFMNIKNRSLLAAMLLSVAFSSFSTPSLIASYTNLLDDHEEKSLKHMRDGHNPNSNNNMGIGYP
ncbi:MAG: hypothetical protein ACTHJ4_08580, partial [Candidatus Nucleicultricaceae bacterium]